MTGVLPEQIVLLESYSQVCSLEESALATHLLDYLQGNALMNSNIQNIVFQFVALTIATPFPEIFSLYLTFFQDTVVEKFLHQHWIYISSVLNKVCFALVSSSILSHFSLFKKFFNISHISVEHYLIILCIVFFWKYVFL